MVKQLDDQREVDNLGRGQPATVVTTHHAVENGMEDLSGGVATARRPKAQTHTLPTVVPLPKPSPAFSTSARHRPPTI